MIDPRAPALELKNLRKTYADGTEALRGIDLEVEQGDFFALLGPNGAGKSTAIGIVASLVNKSAGSVRIFGHDLYGDRDAARTLLGVVPQEVNFNQFETVSDILLNQAGYYGLPRRLARTRAEHYLRKLELWDKRETNSRSLSGGMKRRLMIARALVHEPPLLILDEPTAGVDIEIRRSMWVFLQEMNAAGRTIILTTHYLEEAESLCRNIAIIDRGVIAERDDMAALLTRLHTEHFVLNLAAPLERLPADDTFAMQLTDSTTVEVEVRREQTLNEVFAVLDEAGIAVSSLRNKSNRLEQLFMNLVDKGRGAGSDVGRG
ncbi:MAG: ABC transporter ATP-binding protein [Pseudomonadota bacterium]